MTDLIAQAMNLRERLAAHVSRHADGEDDALECVRLADQLLHAIRDIRVNASADAALQEANEIAVIIGQYPRMMNSDEYHGKLAEHGRRLRALLNAAGYPAPGSVPPE